MHLQQPRTFLGDVRCRYFIFVVIDSHVNARVRCSFTFRNNDRGTGRAKSFHSAPGAFELKTNQSE
ncbi:hypothetical protein PUN28_017260 [Cardiocondyla obscurior]|uniref:Uncharacterized protein n=1 Tax=Cardiocondyla obscurior TaxID=286306 RepID=A0AAW2EKZ5_9HYME